MRVDKAVERELSRFGFRAIQHDRILNLDLRTRFGRGRVRFATVPETYDRNAGDGHIVNAALTVGLYPKILTVDSGSGHLRTLGNNQPVSFHPSSVNFHRRPKDFDVNHLCYFTLMYVPASEGDIVCWASRSIQAFQEAVCLGIWASRRRGVIPLVWRCRLQSRLILASFLAPRLTFLLARQLPSNSAFLDRKVKFSLQPKTNVALKCLRERLSSVLATQMRGKPLSPAQQKWNDLALLVLSHAKVELDEDDEAIVRQPPSVDLIF